jgi:rRNA maturation protein Rpf1
MITTGRHASQATKDAARAAALRMGERYEARGKKTMDRLAFEARRLGEATVGVVEERAGKPPRMAVAEVDELGRWRWAEERLLNPAGEEHNQEGLH